MATVRGEVSIVNNGTSFFTGTASGGSTAGAALIAGIVGSSIYITDVIFSALTVCSITLREDTTTVNYLSVDLGFTGLLGGETFNHSFQQPIKITAGKPVQYTATDKVKVNVCGFYAI